MNNGYPIRHRFMVPLFIFFVGNALFIYLAERGWSDPILFAIMILTAWSWTWSLLEIVGARLSGFGAKVMGIVLLAYGLCLAFITYGYFYTDWD